MFRVSREITMGKVSFREARSVQSYQPSPNELGGRRSPLAAEVARLKEPCGDHRAIPPAAQPDRPRGPVGRRWCAATMGPAMRLHALHTVASWSDINSAKLIMIPVERRVAPILVSKAVEKESVRRAANITNSRIPSGEAIASGLRATGDRWQAQSVVQIACRGPPQTYIVKVKKS